MSCNSLCVLVILAVLAAIAYFVVWPRIKDDTPSKKVTGPYEQCEMTMCSSLRDDRAAFDDCRCSETVTNCCMKSCKVCEWDFDAGDCTKDEDGEIIYIDSDGTRACEQACSEGPLLWDEDYNLINCDGTKREFF